MREFARAPADGEHGPGDGAQLPLRQDGRDDAEHQRLGTPLRQTGRSCDAPACQASYLPIYLSTYLPTYLCLECSFKAAHLSTSRCIYQLIHTSACRNIPRMCLSAKQLAHMHNISNILHRTSSPMPRCMWDETSTCVSVFCTMVFDIQAFYIRTLNSNM